MSRLFAATSALVAFGWLCGCASVNPPGPGLTLMITDSFATIHPGDAPVTLKVAIANGNPDVGVSWSLAVANTACAPACGTIQPVLFGVISLSAIYTPPKTIPLNQTATITAVSLQDKSKIYAFNFTIVAEPTVTITNKFTSQTIGGAAVTVNATVTNDPANAGVTWTLTAGGGNCAPACGTLTAAAAPSFSASYTPPLVLPSGANSSPTITATSVSDTSASDSFGFTILGASGKVKGSYAFLLRGYDGNSQPMAMAGSLTADGSGNITGGELDFNDDGGVTSVPSPITGTYSVDTSFNGALRGTIQLTSYTFPGSKDNIVLQFVLSADGSRGRLIEFDGSAFVNAGTILLQDPAALSAANPAGTYAFGLDSDAPIGGRIVETGQISIATVGAVTGVVDQSKAGGNPGDPAVYSAAPIASGKASTPDSSGRGTLTLTIGTVTSQYAYYIVNSGQLDLIQIDQGLAFGTVQAGVAQLQKALTASSVNTTSVLQMTGVDVSPVPPNNIGPDVVIGVMTVSGANTFSLTFDFNDLGSVFTSHPPITGPLTFDPTTGRGTISVNGGFNAGFVDTAVFYLYDSGKGFIIDTDPSPVTCSTPGCQVTNNAFSGTFTPQAAGPFSTQSISGNLTALFGASVIPNIPNVVAAANFNGTDAFTAIGDLTSLNPPVGAGNLLNVSFNGNDLVSDFTLGYGIAQLPAGLFGNFSTPNQTVSASFYIIGPNQFVLIGTQSGLNSGVVFFDPQ